MESATLKLDSFIRENKFWLLAVAALLFWIYYPIYPLMVSEWYNDQNFSHGFLVPLISGYFLYQSMGELRETPVSGSLYGVPLLGLGVLLLVGGYAGTEYFTMRSSSIIMLAGIILFTFGRQVMRIVALPVFYLLLMVPVPYVIYNAVAFPLKLFVAKYSVIALKLVGIVVWREGNIILFPNIELEVADACSGIRSLFSLIALAVAFSLMSQSTNLKRVILVASAVPIAIFANGVRVFLTGVLAQYWGSKAAEGFFHEFAGFAVFVLAILMLGALSYTLRRFPK